ncbi:MAG: TolC family protein, partial [Planctomycetales bacterium]|nr:TolC family protein [Planctomycetales bacterium]
LRRVELLLARDRANLDQGMHATVHSLATNIRSLDQAYASYVAFKKAHAAANINLTVQDAKFRIGLNADSARTPYLNVLQAISDWGNTISGEANALAQYNVQLATLERQTGTILETHGVYLYEERYGSIGPLGRFAEPVCYPESNRPTPNDGRYSNSDDPAEESFNLTPPQRIGPRKPQAPPPEETPTPSPTPSPTPVPGSRPTATLSPVRQASATQRLPETQRLPPADVQDNKIFPPRFLPKVRQ